MWRQLHMSCQGRPPSLCLRPSHPHLRSFTLLSAARDSSSASSVGILYPPVYACLLHPPHDALLDLGCRVPTEGKLVPRGHRRVCVRDGEGASGGWKEPH